eukprot:365918-Chlamydomonas_euryale.AAC.6
MAAVCAAVWRAQRCRGERGVAGGLRRPVLVATFLAAGKRRLQCVCAPPPVHFKGRAGYPDRKLWLCALHYLVVSISRPHPATCHPAVAAAALACACSRLAKTRPLAHYRVSTRRRIRDGKIAVAPTSASSGVGLTVGGSTLLLDRPCQDPCRGLCVQADNSRVLCCHWHASPTRQHWAVAHRGSRSAEVLCTNGYTHMGMVLPGRQLLSGDMLGTMTQLTQLDIMADPEEDGHEEHSLTTLK